MMVRRCGVGEVVAALGLGGSQLRVTPENVVAWGRFELYSKYVLQIQAVTASTSATR